MTSSHATGSPRFIPTPSGYLMVLRQGDDLFAALEHLMTAEDIPSASLVGLGFAGTVTFGFYDFSKKDFTPRTFENVEMASLAGSLAWQDGKPSIHAHGTAGNEDFSAFGGHILGLVVGTGSLEVTITRHDRRLERTIEPSIGANVLRL